jgi:hypothetical protein
VGIELLDQISPDAIAGTCHENRLSREVGHSFNSLPPRQ